MSMSSQEPAFGADIYYYFILGKRGKKLKKVRVRISEKQINEYGTEHYALQRVRDGYITWWKPEHISGLTLESH